MPLIKNLNRVETNAASNTKLSIEIELAFIELERLTQINKGELISKNPKQILIRIKKLDAGVLKNIVDIFQFIAESLSKLHAESCANDAYKKALLILQYIESENAYYSHKRMDHMQQLKNKIMFSPVNYIAH